VTEDQSDYEKEKSVQLYLYQMLNLTRSYQEFLLNLLQED